MADESTDKQEPEFRRVVQYTFASTGMVPASVLLRELASRNPDTELSKAIIDICDEANDAVKEVVDKMQDASRIVTLD